MSKDFTHHTIATNGVHLHVVEAGPKDGEPVVLLHGFPEFWYGWIHQILFLAEKGYRVIVPDQRGYNLSDKPKNIAEYQIDILALDIIGLIRHFGYQQTYIVGHDWGAGVAWWLGIKHQEWVKKLVILNVPHPNVMKQHMFKNFRQTLRSWYIFFFQIPALPEAALSKGNFKPLRDVLKKTNVPDAYSDQDLEKYIASWSQPNALKSMINWYRAMKISARKNNSTRGKMRVSVPMYMIWGEQDSALGKEMVEPSLAFCDNAKVTRFPEATHWLLREYPDKVNKCIYDFLGSSG